MGPFSHFNPFFPDYSETFSHLETSCQLYTPRPPKFFLPSLSSCPFYSSPFDSDLDLFVRPHSSGSLSRCPFFPDSGAYCHDLVEAGLSELDDRVAALELGFRKALAFPERKYNWETEVKGDGGRKYKWETDLKGDGGRKYKWEAEVKGDGGRLYKWETEVKEDGGRKHKWEAEVKSPLENGFDRKWMWRGEFDSPWNRKFKWSKEVKGKGCHEPWEHKWSYEESIPEFHHWKNHHKKVAEKEHEMEKEKQKKKGCCRKVVAIEESAKATTASTALRKAFAKRCVKGKRREFSPQDAAMLIQANYRAHVARRAQMLHSLRDLAIAKEKLREIRAMFCNFSYRRLIAHDAEERQRFTEKIIVLLLTVTSLEGPDYVVRATKKSMIEELELMLEVVDPQQPGQLRVRRRKFDLPDMPKTDGLAADLSKKEIIEEIVSNINGTVRITEEEA